MRPSPVVITDPAGVTWRLSLQWTSFTPAYAVARLRAAAGMRHGPLDGPGPDKGWLIWSNQPPAWLLVAEHLTQDGFRKMWITPALTKAAARKDLNELAQHIESGKPLSAFGMADPEA